MIFIAIFGILILLIIIYCLKKQSEKRKNQKMMLKSIDELSKEIRKIHYIIKDFGEIESFIIYLENSSKKLHRKILSEKEFEEYKIEFKDKMQNQYNTLLYEITFINPNIKLPTEYFGKIS